MTRPIWIALGVTAIVVGTIGLVLPLIPTVPFLLFAAFCFARSSDRLHRWLLNHRYYGPPIRDWNERGAIRPAAKWLATVSIAASFGLAWLLDFPAWVMAVQGVALAGVALFIWTRPSA